MPMALLAVILMPFGLEMPAADGHGRGARLDGRRRAARRRPGRTGLAASPAPPAAALLLVVAGFLWLALWRERWRLAGLVPIALAIPIALSRRGRRSWSTRTARPSRCAAPTAGFNPRRKGRELRGRDTGCGPTPIRARRTSDRQPDVACDQLGCVARLAGRGDGRGRGTRRCA